MSNVNDFIIENGVLKKYVGPGGDVVIPEGVTQIGENAFYGNNKITSIIICDGVEQIGKDAFGHCRKIEAIRLPNTVKSIESGAFYYCDELQELEIPEKAQITAAQAIVADCFHLTKLILPGSLGYEKKFDGSKFALFGCNRVETLVYPGIVLENISPKLQNAAINGFLHYCDRFADEKVRESYLSRLIKKKDKMLQLILRYDDTSLLQMLEDQKKITTKNIDEEYLNPAIEARAVQCIVYLQNWKNANIKTEDMTVALTKELNAKPKNPFSVTELKKNWSFTKDSVDGIKITGYKGKGTDIVIPKMIGKDIVTILGSGCFSPFAKRLLAGQDQVRKNIESVTIPDTVTRIGESAFSYCISLKQVVLPKALRIIESRAFSGCSLALVRIPDGTETIMWFAFADCTKLQTIYIPASATEIYAHAFENCHNLTIHAPAGSYAETYAKENNIPFVAE